QLTGISSCLMRLYSWVRKVESSRLEKQPVCGPLSLLDIDLFSLFSSLVVLFLCVKDVDCSFLSGRALGWQFCGVLESRRAGPGSRSNQVRSDRKLFESGIETREGPCVSASC